jgi:hypothetical protein
MQASSTRRGHMERPGWILGNEAKDKFAQFFANTSSAHAVPMPSHRSLWLIQNQRSLPSWPESRQHHQSNWSVKIKSRLLTSLPQNRKLLPKSQIFHEQITGRAEEAHSQGGQKSQQPEHETSFCANLGNGDVQLICLIKCRSLFWRDTPCKVAGQSATFAYFRLRLALRAERLWISVKGDP